MMSGFLTMKGYSVLTSDDPFQAIEQARQFEQPLHLLITDINLSGMDGLQLARELRTLHPEVGVLFASGERAEELDIILAETSGVFLPKPFTAQQLYESVRGMVEGPSVKSPHADA
jgi:DNA-binding response OmpR family regulator